MAWLHTSGWMGCLFTAMLVMSVNVAASPQATKNLMTGFVLAQSCEKELDDDMTSYAECIGHAMDRVVGQKQVLLGLHFQAWLIADLAARQNSPRSSYLRQQQAKSMQRQLRATGMKLEQLCQAKSISCHSVRIRMAQRL